MHHIGFTADIEAHKKPQIAVDKNKWLNLYFIAQIQWKEAEGHLQTPQRLKNLKEATEKLEFLQKQVQELTAVSL